MKDDKRSFRQKAGDFLSGKGFYIALTACVLVIGISAWTLLFTSGIADRTNVVNSDDGNATMAGTQSGRNDAEDTLTLPFANRDKDKENAAGENGGKTDVKPDGADDIQTEQKSPETQADEGIDTKPEQAPASLPGEDDAVETMAPAPLKFMWPVYGDVSIGYFVDELVYNKTMMDWRTHNAIDIAAELGTKVMAVAGGTVSKVYNDDLLGTTVIIDHGEGLQSIYSNLAATPTVAENDTVIMGAVIGSVGNTAIGETGDAVHLHFAMLKSGASIDPYDYLPAR